MNSQVSEPNIRERSARFMSTPQLWPQWPFLPLVRRHDDGDMDYGVMADLFGAMALPGYGATVFGTNLFSLPKKLEGFLQLPHETFDTVDEVVAAGWTVD